MFAKVSLILALVAGLFFSTQVFPFTSPAEMAQGRCAKTGCVMGCCGNKACCDAMEQHRVPQPIQGKPYLDLVGMVGRCDFATLYFLPPPRRSFAIRDDAHGRHTPPLVAVTCIRLI
jgi:hypothetical protein